MSIGRNDACPCGSGKKYKKCHGAGDREALASPEAARATTLKACDTELVDRLMRFARTRHGPNWLSDVLESEGLLDRGELPDAELPFVIPWLQHFRLDPDGLTLAEEWRRDAGNRVSPDECLLLDAYRAAWVSAWKVVEVHPGVGSRLADLLTREERFVHDVRSSTTLQQFDSVLAIILTCDGISFFGGVHAQPLAPRFADQVVQATRRACRVRTRPVTVEKLRDPDRQLDLLALWGVVVGEMLDQPLPSLQNTDGDPFVLTRDDFALAAPQSEVAERLRLLPGVEESEPEGDDTIFVATKPGNAMQRSWDNTIIGRLVLTATRLTIETNSTRRADRLRSLVEEQFRVPVRFRLRKEENTAQVLAAARAAGATRDQRPGEPLPPEALAALRGFRERHLRDWVDTAVPALGGLTPREAARSPGARGKLEILLEELEQTEARLPEHERLDLRWLHEALGSGH